MNKLLLLILLCSPFNLYADSEAVFNKIWIEHNVKDSNGRNMMKIHTDVEVNGAKGKDIRFYAYLLDKNGNYIKDDNGNYYCRYYTANATYENTHWDNLQVFLRYGDLPLIYGQDNYKVMLAAKCDGKWIGTSKKEECVLWNNRNPKDKSKATPKSNSSKNSSTSSHKRRKTGFDGTRTYYLIQCLTTNSLGTVDVVNGPGDCIIELTFDEGKPYFMQKNGVFIDLEYSRSVSGGDMYSCNGRNNHQIGINPQGELVEVIQPMAGVVQRNVYSTTPPDASQKWNSHIDGPTLNFDNNSSSFHSNSKNKRSSQGVCTRCNGTGIDPILVDYHPSSRTKSNRIPAYTRCPYCGETKSCDHWHQRCLDCSHN